MAVFPAALSGTCINCKQAEQGNCIGVQFYVAPIFRGSAFLDKMLRAICGDAEQRGGGVPDKSSWRAEHGTATRIVFDKKVSGGASAQTDTCGTDTTRIAKVK